MEKAKPRHGGWTKRNRIGFMYVCIWIFGFLVFQLYPFISSLLYSFTNYDIFHAPEFVGLDNYVKLFTKDREFWNSMAVTLKYTFITVPGKGGAGPYYCCDSEPEPERNQLYTNRILHTVPAQRLCCSGNPVEGTVYE